MIIRVKITRQKPERIVTMDLEEYLRGVVPSEMPSKWHMEALKAQAVAARTYAAQRMRKSGDYDVDDTVSYQAYRLNYYKDSTDEAVRATAGEVLRYKGKLAQTVYSSSNGGETRSAKQRWGNDIPYLPRQRDPYNEGIPRDGHSVGMSQHGAREAAEQGLSYEDILAFYYPGTVLGQLEGDAQPGLDEPEPRQYPCRLTVATQTDPLMLRDAPGAGGKVLARMAKGATVYGLAEQDGWIDTLYDCGAVWRGWACAKYLDGGD